MQSKLRSITIATRQRGQAALIAVLLVLGIATTVLIYTLATPARITIENDQKTAAALAQAKEALIGYATADNRPGSLPCPDVTNNGSAGTPFPTDCPGYITGNTVYVGRLPWRTLGLPDLRDGNGERLWYAVSREFARNPACGGTPSGANCPLNSDTSGQIVISGGSSEVIAIVFSPGAVVLDSQVRDTANENVASNYLEGGNENGATTSIFFTSSAVSFNDKLLLVTREALFPPVELRVARELRLLLRNYYEGTPTPNNRYYPFAAPFPGGACAAGTYRGYIPTSGCPPLADLTLPSWITTNKWNEVMVYAVAPRCTPKIDPGLITFPPAPDPTALICLPLGLFYSCIFPDTIDTTVLNCTNSAAGPFLTITGISTSVEAIVMPTSYRLGQPVRPCNVVSDCLEAVGVSTENIDVPITTYM